MKYYVRIIDESGLFIEDAFVDELNEHTIDTPCPSGFYKPRWSGDKWVEGTTQEEIDELTKPQPHEPTVEERLEQTEELLKTVTMAFTEYVFTQGTSDDS